RREIRDKRPIAAGNSATNHSGLAEKLLLNPVVPESLETFVSASDESQVKFRSELYQKTQANQENFDAQRVTTPGVDLHSFQESGQCTDHPNKYRNQQQENLNLFPDQLNLLNLLRYCRKTRRTVR